MKTLVIAVISLFNTTLLNAQDVLSGNKYSLRAPANIKIDGMLTEWNGKLKEYSSHTQFYYAVSNDDKYLYLTIQITKREIIDRIMNGGITLTVNKSGTRTDPNSIHVTYPVVDHPILTVRYAPDVKHGGTATVASLDSFVNEKNTQLAAKTKFIKVLGVKGVDSLISVYNKDGIKAASKFDKQLSLNYELAVSLADLDLDIKNPQKFSYQVMINEVMPIDMTAKDHKPGEIYVSVTLPGQTATDFWGEYTLAK
ncbi:hypothetical protein FO440_17430 [Mucilaginibacter corticis]|uniref:Uncharacterized protein n=1 Tax=Mucilaginibacter corticis TaxID=2597670 RepID=A0A556MI70_9SPHI|nr:hypothetical protein [Mucilaginibacter corticis]TSJ39525.1 hypothetical protein FO440_17430 [Mucilaginibacter corticis]